MTWTSPWEYFLYAFWVGFTIEAVLYLAVYKVAASWKQFIKD